MRLLSSLLAPIAILSAPASAQQNPQGVLDELLATERALSEAAANLSPAEGIASLIAKDGTLFTRPAPVVGPEAAKAALQANPANAGKFARWRPIRGGVSGDGQHGFTMGYLEIEGGDPKTSKRRYLAYWVRGAGGWRVAVMKQVAQAPDETLVTRQPAALPTAIVRPAPANVAEHQKTLIAAEKAFSDRAQVVGLTQAFDEYGRPDAVQVFGPTSFAVGRSAIVANLKVQEKAAAVGPVPINWSADTAIVASSGDLGVTLGKIRSNDPASAPPGALSGGNPYFTVWHRDDASKPWRYIAE